MNILVTGANGQLGNELRLLEYNYPNHCIFFTDVDELDITLPFRIDRFIDDNDIHLVINCAAYTDVNKAETDEEKALLLNATAVKNLADSCESMGAMLIHVSTDYVFDGCGHSPYGEDHPTAPQSAYGRTKLMGELAAMTLPRTVIIRTSWLYSAFGNNFVKTMLRLGKERESIPVVFDQIGTPTYAADLANCIMTIAGRLNTDAARFGIFHFSNEGVCSWYDFAHEIMRQAGLQCVVKPIETSEYPTPATRPPYSVLNKARIKKAYGITIPHWQDSLARCLEQIRLSQ